jgi:hypothetical protein
MEASARQEPLPIIDPAQTRALLYIVEKAVNINTGELGYQVAKHQVSTQLAIPSLMDALEAHGLVEHWIRHVDMYRLTPDGGAFLAHAEPEDAVKSPAPAPKRRRRTSFDDAQQAKLRAVR